MAQESKGRNFCTCLKDTMYYYKGKKKHTDIISYCKFIRENVKKASTKIRHSYLTWKKMIICFWLSCTITVAYEQIIRSFHSNVMVSSISSITRWPEKVTKVYFSLPYFSLEQAIAADLFVLHVLRLLQANSKALKKSLPPYHFITHCREISVCCSRNIV